MVNLKMANILVVAAHPDDETLGCGATMSKHVENGDSVSVIILGTGIASRKESGSDISSELKKLRSDCKSALAKIGVTDVSFFDFPDNSFDSIPLLSIVKSVEDVIAKKKPSIIYTHHWGDLNVDHRLTFNAVMTASRPFNCSVHKILCFEVLSSTEWNVANSANSFMPNVFVDVSKNLEKKISALSQYKSEMRDYPHPRSLKGNEYLAKYRGLIIGVAAAEAFELAREVIR